MARLVRAGSGPTGRRGSQAHLPALDIPFSRRLHRCRTVRPLQPGIRPPLFHPQLTHNNLCTSISGRLEPFRSPRVFRSQQRNTIG